jgi:hypothetical protein
MMPVQGYFMPMKILSERRVLLLAPRASTAKKTKMPVSLTETVLQDSAHAADSAAGLRTRARALMLASISALTSARLRPEAVLTLLRGPRPPAHAPGPSHELPGRERPAQDFAMVGSDMPAPGRPRPRSGSCGINSDTSPTQNMARKIINALSLAVTRRACAPDFSAA